MGKGKKSKKAQEGVKSKAIPAKDQHEVSTASNAHQPMDDQETVDQSIASQPVSDRRGNSSHNNSSHIRIDQNGTICEICKIARGGVWIVQCDKCDLWFHFNCVNFNSEEVGEDDPWFCMECRGKDLNSEASQSDNRVNRIYQVEDNHARPNNSDHRESTIHGMNAPLSNSFVQLIPRSTQNQTSTNLGVRFMENPVDSTIESGKMLQRLVSSISEPEQIQSSVVGRESQRIIMVRESDNTWRYERLGVERPASECQPMSYISKSVQALHRTPQVEDILITQVPSDATNGQTIPIKDKRLAKANDVTSRPSSSKARSASSKTTVSSQSRAKMEQQRLQEELDLQAKFDEERIALKLEGLALKESRERRFLEEKFKAMNDEDDLSSDRSSIVSKGSKQSQSSKNQTAHVLTWIEDQRRQKSQNIQRHPEISIEVSDKEMERMSLPKKMITNLAAGIVIDRPPERSAQLNPKAYSFRANVPNENHGIENPLSSRNQPDASVRVNSTLIQDDQAERLPYDQRYRLIPPSHGQNIENHQASNKRLDAKVVQRNQEAGDPPVSSVQQIHSSQQQNPINYSVGQPYQNVQPSYQQYQGQMNSQLQQVSSSSYQQSQNFMNPSIISSQPNMHPLNQQRIPPQQPMYSSSQQNVGQQSSGFSQMQNGQTHQSIHASNQFTSGWAKMYPQGSQLPTYTHQPNMNQNGIQFNS